VKTTRNLFEVIIRVRKEKVLDRTILLWVVAKEVPSPHPSLFGFSRVQFRECGGEQCALLREGQELWENFESFWEAGGGLCLYERVNFA